MPWKILDKRRNENTISEGRETNKTKPQAQILFLCLNQQKKNSFQRLLSSTPWNKLAIIYNSKKRKCVTFTNTFAFCLIYLVVECACLSERSDNTCIKTSTHLTANNTNFIKKLLKKSIICYNVIVYKEILWIK